MGGLELGVAVDLDHLERERHLRPHLPDDVERRLAQVAAATDVDDDAGWAQGYRPRVVVASATRCTASP